MLRFALSRSFLTLLVYVISFAYICSFVQFKPKTCDVQAHKGDKIKVHYRVCVLLKLLAIMIWRNSFHSFWYRISFRAN